jgi:hypothetical protein
MKELQQDKPQDEMPLHELVRVSGGVPLHQPIEIDGVKVVLSVKPLSEIARFHATHIWVQLNLSSRDGLEVSRDSVKNEELETFLKEKVVNWKWWEGGCYLEKRVEQQSATCRKLAKLVGQETVCYVCHDYADHRTPCGHAICTRCFYQSFTDEGREFRCGVCRRGYYTEDGEELLEEGQ